MKVRNQYDDLTHLRQVFEETVIIRKPLHRIIRGYHQLPYIVVGQSFTDSSKTLEIRGKIHVSPRMVIRPGELGQTYGEIFGEENVDQSIVARFFGFLYMKERTTRFISEDLSIHELNIALKNAIARVLDEIAKKESIDTGVIHSPDINLYPVSVDRYIREMLDKELSTGTVR
jgi:hypothetical protein